MEKLGTEKEQLLKNEKSSAMEKVASVYSPGHGQVAQQPYPSPFITLSDMSMPNKMTELFKMCKYYYTFDPLVAGAINALASFPITEIFMEESNNAKKELQERLENREENVNVEEESPQLKQYKRVILDQLGMHKLLVGIGIDYWLYGNCFVFGEMWMNPVTKQKEWKHLVRLDPSKVIIDKNDATQEVRYKWMVPDRIKRIVKTKKPLAEYDKIPQMIKDAVKKNETVVINPNNIYHLSRPSDSMGDTMWGPPVIANVMKLLLYRNVLRQAQEAIAREHIVPFRVYYFEQTSMYNPGGDMSNVISSFAKELAKSSRDPNYKVISPVPVGVLNLGGQGKSLMLTPEIEQVQAEILAGMGVPREFIFGGMSWSGSSISLKILENQFITYRLLVHDFLQNFVVKNMARARGEWSSDIDDDSVPTIEMSEIKMQDDVQQKQLIISLNQTGKVPDEIVWKTMGFDPDNMRESLKEEAKRKIEFDEEIEILRVESQTRIQMAQVKAQMELQKLQTKLQTEFQMSAENQEAQQVQQQQAAAQQPPEEGAQEEQVEQQQTPVEKAKPEQPKKAKSSGNPQIDAIVGQLVKMPPSEALKHLQALQSQLPAPIVKQIRDLVNEARSNSQGQEDAGMSAVEAQKAALQLMKMPEQERNAVLAKIPAKQRMLIEQMLNEMSSQEPSGEEEPEEVADMRPMPTQRPPRRDSLK